MLERTLLLSGLALSLQSCFLVGASCTEAGCAWDDGAIFDFGDRYMAWESEQGTEYVFTVTFDGEDHVCSGVNSVDDSITCDSDLLDVWSYTSGMGESATAGVEALQVYAFPGSTHLEVERDGEVVFSGDFDIVAEVDYPNGERCDPRCEYWTDEVSW